MSENTPDLSWFREKIREQRSLLFVIGHMNPSTGQYVPVLDRDGVDYLYNLWRNHFSRHAPPEKPIIETREDALEALDRLLRRLEELFGPELATDTPRADAVATEPATAKRKATINAKMIDVLGKKPDAKNWTVRRWQAELHCSVGGIARTNVWKSMKLDREQLKAERTRDRRRKKKPHRTD
jgi:hypothetical protein